MCNSSQGCTFHANQGRVIWMGCVESMVHSEPNVPNVHTLVKSFQDYCEYVFLPSIENMQYVNRLDSVWDVYGDDSQTYEA